MRYLGSKTLLLNDIFQIVEEYKPEGVFCDPFGGIGTVGRYMKEKGYQVITGDILFFAHCFQVALIENNGEVTFSNLKALLNVKSNDELSWVLNNERPKDGWLVEEYSNKRFFFTNENAKKIQACYDCIQLWRNKRIIDEKEYKVLIASLIQSFDKVANTAGTYYAYLKNYYRKALKSFVFNLLEPVTTQQACRSYYGDANQLVKECVCDVLYLDPPYNERNYERYYHLPENVAQGITPIPAGKSGVFTQKTVKSPYNKRVDAIKAFEQLIEECKAGCIVFHYTDNGLIEIEKARSVLKKQGKIDEFYFDSKGYSVVRGMETCQHHIIRVIR